MSSPSGGERQHEQGGVGEGGEHGAGVSGRRVVRTCVDRFDHDDGRPAREVFAADPVSRPVDDVGAGFEVFEAEHLVRACRFASQDQWFAPVEAAHLRAIWDEKVRVHGLAPCRRPVLDGTATGRDPGQERRDQ